MIEIKRDGTQVKVVIDASIPYSYPFIFSCNQEAYAEFLARDLREKLFKTLQQIRQEAYLEGWKDKSTHKPKSNWWSGNWK